VQPLLQWGGKVFFYSACVFLTLGLRHAVRLRRIFMLPDTVFFKIIINHDFRRKLIENVSFDSVYNFVL
jgi:hypothetical protein